jgi:uncharacterized protein YkwD
MGREHSEVMAREGEIGHVEPDGDTIEDRYRARGLLPECRLPIEDSRNFYPGAENAVQTWYGIDVREPNGVMTIDDEQDLAQNILINWMTSPPHRKVLLLASASEVGLGMAIADGNKVYAAAEFC